MDPMIDPRQGDIEDDARKTKRRYDAVACGSRLAEISFRNCNRLDLFLIGLPCLLLAQLAPRPSIWVKHRLIEEQPALFTRVAPDSSLAALIGSGWFGGRQFLRWPERSLRVLNSLAAQPGTFCAGRDFEILGHDRARFPPAPARPICSFIQAATAVASGVTNCVLALWILSLAWPTSLWKSQTLRT